MPKALALLDGEPLLIHALRSLLAAPSIGAVVVCAPASSLAEARALCEQASDRPVVVVAGGADRQASVARGLAAMPKATDVVLVHDAARALVPPDLVERVIAAVRAGAGAVVPALPVTDTIKQVRGTVVSRTVDRADLVAVQTPQGFRRDVLEKAHAAAGTDLHTDDAGLVERLGCQVVVVPGHPDAIKITTPADVVAASAILAARTSS
jgi:2-C-methyl-D-erythritol 4-phosphate cytidylyltransferase